MTSHWDQRLWDTIAAVPPGRVASYGQIAAMAGLARGARRTAAALRNAPDELALPWYRILRADGRIAFEPGSAAFERQCALLMAEGVELRAGRVDLGRYRWRGHDSPLLD
ncbi:MGMT family protein [Algiphilus sp. W345]|uniref:MGMT family protein n=1 Tax=Banduia mediterranea TaxID=3075609 RepID=A0ABU2WLT0_9GAMM|nr:MGMT family protein [Algiphilus sp. W345]MDT0498829.1 MGMT family protein [Algiphilus sp. W345]